MSEPLAYHITWTTYGSWLHGDQRGWVETGTLEIKPGDSEREEETRGMMKESAVVLTEEQRALVEQVIRQHCAIRGWTLHAINVRTNHVHVVISADRSPEEVMSQLKAWTSRRLSDQAGLTTTVAKKAGRRRWWTEHGSTKYINGDAYLENAVRYVDELQ
jgi:REP element-mobilizing transposase RayT